MKLHQSALTAMAATILMSSAASAQGFFARQQLNVAKSLPGETADDEGEIPAENSPPEGMGFSTCGRPIGNLYQPVLGYQDFITALPYADYTLEEALTAAQSLCSEHALPDDMSWRFCTVLKTATAYAVSVRYDSATPRYISPSSNLYRSLCTPN